MNNINEVAKFYNNNKDLNKCELLYNNFKTNANNFNNSILLNHFNNTVGFGELSFFWSWFLLVNDMPNNFKFLEIGVYKGKVLSLIQLLSNQLNKQVKIFGVTPLNISSDKYSSYDNVDYLQEIKKTYSISNLSFDNTTIIEGYSQDDVTISKVEEHKLYDIIFIDGCHDYEIVCLDIQNYSKMLKNGGYLVMDDCSSLLEGAYGEFLGHYDVGKAAKDMIECDNNFVHLYSVGHNRIWQKK